MTAHLLIAILWLQLCLQFVATQVVTVFAGGGTASSTDGQGTLATFNVPISVKSDAAGNLYVADQYGNKIRKITQSGLVTTIAGSGVASSLDGQGTLATFNLASDLALDSLGNIYVAGFYGNNIRKINSSGYVSTFAGSGTASSSDGQGTSATFNVPVGITMDSNGTLYVTELTGKKSEKNIQRWICQHCCRNWSCRIRRWSGIICNIYGATRYRH